MKALNEAFHRDIANRFSELRKRLDAAGHFDVMPSSLEDWEELDNLIALVEQTGDLCRMSYDTAAACCGVVD